MRDVVFFYLIFIMADIKDSILTFSNKSMLSWIVAFCLMEFPMKYFYIDVIGGPNVAKWYDFKTFNVYNVMAGDLFYVLVGIIITYRLFNAYVKEKRFWKFYMIFSLVQILGDLTFYTTITRIIPRTIGGKWLTFFRNYGKSAGIFALLGDNIYILVWSLVAYAVYNMPLDIKYAVIFGFMFLLSIIAESN